MIALQRFPEFLQVLPAIVGIDNKMIRFGDMPVGLCRHGER